MWGMAWTLLAACAGPTGAPDPAGTGVAATSPGGDQGASAPRGDSPLGVSSTAAESAGAAPDDLLGQWVEQIEEGGSDGAGSETSLGQGLASFYGRKFHGRRTASGERFDMHALTAAHRDLPFGTKLRVRNLRNGKEVVVRVNDRGPFKKGRIIDVSRAAAEALGMLGRGIEKVELLRE